MCLSSADGDVIYYDRNIVVIAMIINERDILSNY